MNAITILAGLLLYGLLSETAFACELCKQNQPDALQGISHGTGPQASTDYIIIWCALVLVAIALFFSLKFLIRPNEDRKDHVKNIVIENLWEA